jgi:hypothetical protein
MYNLCREKVSQKLGTNFVIFEKWPKESNRPIFGQSGHPVHDLTFCSFSSARGTTESAQGGEASAVPHPQKSPLRGRNAEKKQRGRVQSGETIFIFVERSSTKERTHYPPPHPKKH